MIETRFTRLLGCSAPIQLAGMPGISTPALVSAVAAAGGVGMLPAPMMSPAALERILDELGSAAPGVYGVNFLLPFLDPECVAVAARLSPLIEFFYGDPDPHLVEQVHDLGARVSWQVGSVAEATAAERAACDLVVAQGTEAGGHVRGHTSLFPLLSQVLEVVQIPVLAPAAIAKAPQYSNLAARGCRAKNVSGITCGAAAPVQTCRNCPPTFGQEPCLAC